MENFDYNLVKVFCSLFDTENLTETARMLNISQPAVSQSLKKLRNIYDDDLFVRTSGNMKPTIFSRKIIDNLKKSIELIELSLNQKGYNDNLFYKKNYNIVMSDLAQSFFIPPLCLLLDEANLNIDINILQVNQLEMEVKMREGKIDFAIGNFPALKDNINLISENLFQDCFVLMIRDGHPLIKSDGDFNNYNSLSLIGVDNNITGHSEVVNKILNKLGCKNKMNIPYYSAAPDIVEKTDYGVIMPSFIAKKYNFHNTFKIFPILIKENLIEVDVIYHKLFKNEKSTLTLRDMFVNNFRNR